ncbi:MAG TPA: hypothetical protein VHL52_08655 [Acidimicrobiia bacterium]|nr:hypothetical protein [Acidimicrobiia bacterium]
MPPTEDNPMGYFEALGVVDAHRDQLAQMERDWTCPPSTFRPGLLNLSALEEQVDIHKQLPEPWAMKDPRSMFLLPAWSHLGIDRVRVISVVRPVADTVRSIEKRDHIRQDRAEAIVDVYLRRLVEIAERVPLPVVQFPGEGDSLIRQVRDLAAALELPWDEEAAREFFDPTLVRNRSPLHDSSPTYDLLIDKARNPKRVPSINLRSLRLSSEPEWPLETHLGVRYAQHRNQLWEMAHFSTDPEPTVVEVLLEGARRGGTNRPGVRLHQVEASGPLAVGAALMKTGQRPHGVIAHGFLAGRSFSEIEFLFRSVYINTHPLAEFFVDVPDPRGEALLSVTPAPAEIPRPTSVQEIATQSGWDHVTTDRLSPGRSGMFFRKRLLTDSELTPVITDLIANIERIRTIDNKLSAIENRLNLDGIGANTAGHFESEDPVALEAERKRADEAERALYRLRNRRSVKLALTMSRPARGIFRTVRSWKKSS